MFGLWYTKKEFTPFEKECNHVRWHGWREYIVVAVDSDLEKLEEIKKEIINKIKEELVILLLDWWSSLNILCELNNIWTTKV